MADPLSMALSRRTEGKMVVVLFGTKMREDANLDEYRQRSRRMNELVRQIPGFISIKGFVADDGDEVSIARFESEDALDAWRSQPDHVETQHRAREAFYESYWVQVCKTLRDYEFSLGAGRVVHDHG
jgi:heme-degrading monooxygenase HmoA